MLTISYLNREEESAATYESAVSILKNRFRQASFSKHWEQFGSDYERQLVWATPTEAACDVIGFRAVAQILRPSQASTSANPVKAPKKNSRSNGKSSSPGTR